VRLLDLFCGAGGAAMGYHRAGFDVVGVDINPQPNYPFEFHQADAMTYPLDTFDAIHASPPCHDHSNVTGRNRRANCIKSTGWMLAATIERLTDVPVSWFVENVETADMPDTVHRFKLCGSSFGLDVRRHRWFATNTLMLGVPPCDHAWQTPRFRSCDSRRPVGSLASVVGVHGHLNYAGEFAVRCEAMGIDWMPNDRLSQAIPPAYTEWIGRQLVDAVERAA
jgi:DNA (cytosine-5)-methyltransferase 1